MQSKKDVISKHKTYQFCDGLNDIDKFAKPDFLFIEVRPQYTSLTRSPLRPSSGGAGRTSLQKVYLQILCEIRLNILVINQTRNPTY